jgi:hypothetical protein
MPEIAWILTLEATPAAPTANAFRTESSSMNACAPSFDQSIARRRAISSVVSPDCRAAANASVAASGRPVKSASNGDVVAGEFEGAGPRESEDEQAAINPRAAARHPARAADR